MAIRGTIFLMCLAVLGFTACGPSMEANLQTQLRPFEGDAGGDGGNGGDEAGNNESAKQERIDSFLEENRALRVKATGTSAAISSATLNLYTNDRMILVVTWVMGHTDTINANFQRIYDDADERDLVFEDGRVILSETTGSGCADLLFEQGPFKAIRLVLCE